MSKGKINHLRWIMLAEGISCIVLFFIAMPLKYIWGMNTAVRIAGGLHGFLFCLACLLSNVVRSCVQHSSCAVNQTLLSSVEFNILGKC